MSEYMPYSVIDYNSTTTVITIPHSSIKAIDFIKAKEPTETLGSVYNRLSDKPPSPYQWWFVHLSHRQERHVVH